MGQTSGRIFRFTAAAAWLAVLVTGAASLWRYDAAAGAPADPPARWPSATRAVRRPGLPALVLLIHPRCPCTRATIDELSRLMSDCDGKLTATVLVLHPAGTPAGWEKSGLWSDAAAIPGVNALSDADGSESRRFGAATSGQAILYSADGRLLFAGGITESRGHSGDNAGRSAITALVLGSGGRPNRAASTPVYGCPLFDTNKGEACRR